VTKTTTKIAYLDSIASGVTLREPVSIATAIPGASLSRTHFVAFNNTDLN